MSANNQKAINQPSLRIYFSLQLKEQFLNRNVQAFLVIMYETRVKNLPFIRGAHKSSFSNSFLMSRFKSSGRKLPEQGCVEVYMDNRRIFVFV